MSATIKLDDLDIYKLAMETGELVWDCVENWNPFARNTIGKQFVEAADSIAANIAEGYGRYTFRDRRNFFYYARGSLMETKTWVLKSFQRNLMDETTYKVFMSKLSNLHYKLNGFIKKIKTSISKE